MIPVNDPIFNNDDFEYLSNAFKSGWVSSAGPYIEEFEKSWADYCNRKYGIAVTNGTVALEVALKAIGIKATDEVIMPTFTIISCAQAITNLGAKPVLVDCDPNTWCMDVKKIEEKVSPATKAIMVVHMYGHPVDMDYVFEIAAKYDLKIIEDAAEVHGAEYLSKRNTANPKWLKCGSMGHVSTFSFFANKLITTGEGGMILTDDPDIKARAESIRNLCFNSERRFKHFELGNNYRFTNLQAAIGVSQIKRIDKIVADKQFIGNLYLKELSQIDGIHLQTQQNWAKSVFWVNGLVLDEDVGLNAENFCKKLMELGIDTRPFFLGMHEQPVFQEMGLFLDEKYEISELIARQGFYLPSGLAMTSKLVEEVIKAVKMVMRGI